MASNLRSKIPRPLARAPLSNIENRAIDQGQNTAKKPPTGATKKKDTQQKISTNHESLGEASKKEDDVRKASNARGRENRCVRTRRLERRDEAKPGEKKTGVVRPEKVERVKPVTRAQSVVERRAAMKEASAIKELEKTISELRQHEHELAQQNSELQERLDAPCGPCQELRTQLEQETKMKTEVTQQLEQLQQEFDQFRRETREAERQSQAMDKLVKSDLAMAKDEILLLEDVNRDARFELKQLHSELMWTRSKAEHLLMCQSEQLESCRDPLDHLINSLQSLKYHLRQKLIDFIDDFSEIKMHHKKRRSHSQPNIPQEVPQTDSNERCRTISQSEPGLFLESQSGQVLNNRSQSQHDLTVAHNSRLLSQSTESVSNVGQLANTPLAWLKQVSQSSPCLVNQSDGSPCQSIRSVSGFKSNRLASYRRDLSQSQSASNINQLHKISGSQSVACATNVGQSAESLPGHKSFVGDLLSTVTAAVNSNETDDHLDFSLNEDIEEASDLLKDIMNLMQKVWSKCELKIRKIESQRDEAQGRVEGVEEELQNQLYSMEQCNSGLKEDIKQSMSQQDKLFADLQTYQEKLLLVQREKRALERQVESLESNQVQPPDHPAMCTTEVMDELKRTQAELHNVLTKSTQVQSVSERKIEAASFEISQLKQLIHHVKLCLQNHTNEIRYWPELNTLLSLFTGNPKETSL